MIKDELRSIPKGMNHGIDDFTKEEKLSGGAVFDPGVRR